MTFAGPYQPAHARVPHGFVLLMVLVLLTLMSLGLVGLARHSAAAAAQAGQAQEALQHKWAILSLTHSLLPQAGSAFARVEAQQDAPIMHLAGEVEINGTVYHWRCSDEQAKANLNALAAERGNLLETIQSLLIQHGGLTALELHPLINPPTRPRSIADTPPVILPEYASWAQVFRDPSPAVLFDWRTTGTTPIDRISLAVSENDDDESVGSTNFRRAHPAVLTAMLYPQLNQSKVNQLIQMRVKHPKDDVGAVLRRLNLDWNERNQAYNILTGHSSLYSLTILYEADSCLNIQYALPTAVTIRRPTARWLIQDWQTPIKPKTRNRLKTR